MRKLGLFLILVIILTSNSTYAFADEDINDSWANASSWAQNDIKKAIELGFIPDKLQCNYNENITRYEFTLTALKYIDSIYNGMLETAYRMPREISGLPEVDVHKKAFSDIFLGIYGYGAEINFAYNIGLINGREDGIFDPDGFISRQAAAMLLQNIYNYYGGKLEQNVNKNDFAQQFADSEYIVQWTFDSMQSMWELGVMQGINNNQINPNGYLTREQCFVAFLRLYENAPISKTKGNIKQLVTYEMLYKYIIGGAGYIDYTYPSQCQIYYEQSTDEYTVLLLNLPGMSHNAEYIYLIYKDGYYKDVHNIPFKYMDLYKFELDELNDKFYIYGPYYETNPDGPKQNYILDLNTLLFTEI